MCVWKDPCAYAVLTVVQTGPWGICLLLLVGYVLPWDYNFKALSRIISRFVNLNLVVKVFLLWFFNPLCSTFYPNTPQTSSSPLFPVPEPVCTLAHSVVGTLLVLVPVWTKINTAGNCRKCSFIAWFFWRDVFFK